MSGGLFSKKDPFENAPYLFPWYPHDDKPLVVRCGERLSWKYVEKIGSEYVGLTTLGTDKNIFAAFQIYTYLIASKTGSYICIWRRDRRDSAHAGRLSLHVFTSDDLKPIPDPDRAMLAFNEQTERQYLLESEPEAQLNIRLTATGADLEFPEVFTEFGDFIAVADIADLYEEPEHGDTALVEILPGQGRAEVYPQDWFNLDPDIDRGYQWITRAVRPRRGGPIVGQGIRIGDFKLDDTGRQLK